MNDSMDRVLTDWLHEGPESGPREGLERALAASHRVGQRPGWTLPERWLPMQLTLARTRSPRPIVAIVIVALLGLAMVATSLFIGSQRRESPAPFRNGAVVFEENGDLFIADELGGAPRALVAGHEREWRPAFSPQGDRVAFVRGDAPDVRIMTVRPDGSGMTELARGLDSTLVELSWAPDGGAILVSGNGLYGFEPSAGERVMAVGRDSRRLYVIETNGSEPRMLDAGRDVTASLGSWRPNGRHIAFVGWLQGGQGAFIANADGTNVRRLPIDSLTGSDGLAWSPDGTHLSFMSPGPTVADIDADGTMTGSHQLSYPPESFATTSPTWSPDGSLLAIMVGQGSTLHVGVFEPDGSGYRIVGKGVPNLVGTELAWSPDGKSVVISQPRQDDVDTEIGRYTERAWRVDLATGELTEVRTPVETWQRLAP